MPWNGCRQYQVTMTLTGAAALRSRLARKAVFSQVRYGQAGCVISLGIIPQRPRVCAHAASAILCNRSTKAIRAGLTLATDPLRTTTERPVTISGGTNRLIDPHEAAAIVGAEQGSPTREDKEWPAVSYLTHSHYPARQPSAQQSPAQAAGRARRGSRAEERLVAVIAE